MTCNNKVTIWHYDEQTGTYSLSHYDCWERGKTKITQTENGAIKANIFVIRIPTTEEIQAVEGDYIKFGVWSDERPPKERCISIAAVTNNRIGSAPHWRIDAI